MKWLMTSRSVQIVSVLLIAEIFGYYAIPKSERPRQAVALAGFPDRVNGWSNVRDLPLEPEVKEVLKADDTMSRIYTNADGTWAQLFVAFFQTQSSGVAPHSPRNCLPGSGWIPGNFRELPVTVEGRAQPIVVNRYTIEQGSQRSVTLYWYQTGSRVVAGEYAAKFYTALDRLLHRRSDTALVRVIVPVSGSEEAAQQAAVDLARAIFPQLRHFLPAD